jgi:hypothetical protein
MKFFIQKLVNVKLEISASTVYNNRKPNNFNSSGSHVIGLNKQEKILSKLGCDKPNFLIN